MGNTWYRCREPQPSQTFADVRVGADEPPAAVRTSPPPQPPSPPRTISLQVDTRDVDPQRLQLQPGPLRDAICRAMPPQCQSQWILLYSSIQHGRNFTQMIKRIRRAGPTLVVIREPTQNDLGDAGHTFGGFVDGEWRTVSEREQEAKSNAAAKARAERVSRQEGSGGPSGAAVVGYEAKPANQSRTYFGTGCSSFVFTSGSPAEEDDGGAPRVYPAKPHVNMNLQYLFDTHPQPNRVGIGMGGASSDGGGGSSSGSANPHDGVAWMLDRHLAHGVCSTTLCPTFGNPRLSASSSFSVAAVEVYAVDPNAYKMSEAGMASTAVDGEGGHTVVTERHAVDKTLLELHGTRFYSDEPRDACC